MPGAAGLVHRAVLAASAHNSQPWRFRVSGDAIAISADLDRHLGSFDPFQRAMHMSLGCALENLVLAARAEGLDARVETPPASLPPSSSGEEAAIVTLTPADREVTDLFLAIRHRHTHRGAYHADRAIPRPVVDEMAAMASAEPAVRLFLFEGGEMEALGRVIGAATEAIVADHQMAADNARWFRFHEREVQERRDGLTLDASVVPPLRNLAAKLFPPSGEQAVRRWLRDTTRVHLATAPLLGMIAVRDLDDRPTALSAGRLWQRLHLLLTARGLMAQPLNQPVVMVDRERELSQPATTAEALAKVAAEPSWLPTIIFRAGHADRPARPSPRRRVEVVIA